MPTLRKDKGGRWMGRVTIAGVQTTKMFPPGKKYGPSWRAAKQWEEDTVKAGFLPDKTRSAYAILTGWLKMFLEHSRRVDGQKTVAEKERALLAFSRFCVARGIDGIRKITPAMVYAFVNEVCDERGPGVANRHLKNLKTAWRWGVDMVDGFPDMQAPFKKNHVFEVEEVQRYVPPASDVIKVLQAVSGQDHVMLLVFYYTGARAGEVFRLRWEDVDLERGIIRLTDHKGGAGHKRRVRSLRMSPVLVSALSWWFDARPCTVDNVFMQTQSNDCLGMPFTHRSKFMPTLCKRLGIKPFGFHSIRHKSAETAYLGDGLNAAQTLMGHYRATTTDRYIRSASLYADDTNAIAALENSEIGMALGSHEEKKNPHEVNQTSWGRSNPESVTQ